MKRPLIIAITTVLVTLLVGCSTSNDKPKPNTDNPGVSTDESKVSEDEESKSYFGKVQDIVGNEVIIKLSDNVVSDTDELEEDDDKSSNSSVDTSMSSGDGGMLMQEETTEISNPYSKMDFSGESKELIIPAGATIFNFSTGKDAKMTDIKKDSIVTITVDSKTNTVVRVEIMW